MYESRSIKLPLFFMFVLIVVSSACTPAYQTLYRYSEPVDEKQAVCFPICEKHRIDCVQIAKSEKRNCELRNQIARMTYRQCLSVNKPGPGAIAPNCDANQDFCFSDIERCDNNFRNCFLDCGGEISEDRICTANCPD